MTARVHFWRGGALLFLLGLAASGCRPLVNTPPGCEEAGAEDCVPEPPASAALVRLLAPSQLLEPSGEPPVFGRFLPVELEVLRSGGAKEVELLCGDRRLATWWPDGLEDQTLTLRALVDLLSCRPPGTDAHPLPITLTVIVEDALGGRHDHGRFELRADFTVEEGEVLEPGDPESPASAHIELSDDPPTDDGFPALLRVEGVLAQAPEIRVGSDLLEVWPVRDGWRFVLPRPDFSADIDALALDVDVQIQLKTGFGVSALIHERVTIERALQTLPLQGDLFSPNIPKPSGWPVMTSQGLVMVVEDTAASTPGSSARLLRIPGDPDGTLQHLTFARDVGDGLGGCSLPGGSASTGTACILGLNGTGQLVVRRPQPAPLNFLISVLAPDAWERWTPDATLAELLQPSIADPAAFSQPRAWARLGTDRVCTEARAASCAGLPCGPFDRVCVLGSGAVEATAPIGGSSASWDAGASSRALGSDALFVTYDHALSLYSTLPLVTVGTPTQGQLGLGTAGQGLWSYQRGVSAVIPVRDGFALVSGVGDSAFFPGGEPQAERVYSRAWDDGRYAFHTIVHVEPDGALVVLGEDWNQVQHLSRWLPGRSVPEVEHPLPPGPEAFEGAPNPSMDLVEDGYSQTFADGSAALVYRVGYTSLPYRLVVVDAQLRPLLRRRSASPMRAELAPAGDTLWLIEAVSTPDGIGNQIVILPR